MVEAGKENRQWYLFDAKGEVLGRLATNIANILRGKGKVNFCNNTDTGDYAVIINAGKIILTGKKEDQKTYYRHTGYIGNLKTTTYKELKETKPEQIITRAVSGMLPKNKLRHDFLARLKVYADSKHPHVNIKFKNK